LLTGGTAGRPSRSCCADPWTTDSDNAVERFSGARRFPAIQDRRSENHTRTAQAPTYPGPAYHVLPATFDGVNDHCGGAGYSPTARMGLATARQHCYWVPAAQLRAARPVPPRLRVGYQQLVLSSPPARGEAARSILRSALPGIAQGTRMTPSRPHHQPAPARQLHSGATVQHGAVHAEARCPEAIKDV